MTPESGETQTEEVSGERPSICPAYGSRDHIFAALAYFAVPAAIVFLLARPFKDSPYIRFHSLQSIFLAVSFVLIFAVLGLAQPAGQLIALLLAALALLFFGIMWIALMVEAWIGKSFRLPLVGALAARQSAR
ncbi:MAG: hypothetical protein M3O09_17480 [Acidobacteriota bacterium]|nr:hypothetical protein [Acidobacteriota bacterium]